jgi:CBS domain-containing protein
MAMLVDTILQSKGTTVYTLPETSTLTDAVAMLNTHNIGALIITDSQDNILGILSERDIIHQLGKDPGGALAQPISSNMTRNVVTCERTTPVSEVMESMTNRRIRHVPVVEEGRLLGIISIGDVVKRKIEEIENDADAMREYISSGSPRYSDPSL